MIVELLLSGVSYYLMNTYDKIDFNEYKKEFNSTIERIPALKNNKNETLQLMSYEPTDYSYKIKFLLPAGNNYRYLSK